MRLHAAVGIATSTETASGVWQDVITERSYYGEIIRQTRHLVPPSLVPPELNSNLTLGNLFSILADADAYANIMNFRYVVWEGNYWTITSVEVARPRLILTIGEQWDGNTA